jgi:hypothetical protein
LIPYEWTFSRPSAIFEQINIRKLSERVQIDLLFKDRRKLLQGLSLQYHSSALEGLATAIVELGVTAIG